MELPVPECRRAKSPTIFLGVSVAAIASAIARRGCFGLLPLPNVEGSLSNQLWPVGAQEILVGIIRTLQQERGTEWGWADLKAALDLPDPQRRPCGERARALRKPRPLEPASKPVSPRQSWTEGDFYDALLWAVFFAATIPLVGATLLRILWVWEHM